MYIFSKKIKCLRCGSNYRGKKEKGKNSYICSGYHNYGSNYCMRNIIYEDELVYIVNKHYYIQHKQDILTSQIKQYVNGIEIGEEGIVIYYSDQTQSVFSNNKVIY